MEKITHNDIINMLFKVRDDLNNKDKEELKNNIIDYQKAVSNNQARHELIQGFIQELYNYLYED